MLDKSTVLNAVESRKQEIIDLLCKLISIESVTNNEVNAQKFVRGFFEELGMEIDEWEIDLNTLSQFKGFSPLEGLSYEGRPSVAAIWRGKKDENHLLFNGHIDTVQADDTKKWISPPFEGVIRDGRLYGRGSADMKGGIAAAMMAIKILKELGFEPEGNIVYTSTPGEEDSVNGTLGFIERGYTAKQAIIPECCGMKIMPGNAGMFSFDIEVKGLQAHHGLSYMGVNAYEKAMVVYNAMLAFQKHRTETVSHPLFAEYEVPVPINMGMIHADNCRWCVPPSAVMECCGEYYPGENAEDVYEQLKAFVLKETAKDPWLKENPPQFRWVMKSYASEAKNSEKFVADLSEAYKEVTGREAPISALACGCDQSVYNLFTDTPAVLLGPGPMEEAHTENESIAVQDLIDCTKIFALYMLSM